MMKLFDYSTNIFTAFCWGLLLLSTTVQAKVVELGLDNLEQTLTSQNWTCVLFYDGLDARKVAENFQILQGLDQEYSTNELIAFAALDIRRHPWYRTIYREDDDPEPFLETYYNEYPSEPDSMLSISSTTFMNLAGEVFWNTRLVLFAANNFNAYGQFSLDYEADVLHKLPVMSRWVETFLKAKPQDVEAIIEAPLNAQKQSRAERILELINEFEFEIYDETIKEKMEEKMVQAAQETPEEELRNFVLETGVSKNNVKEVFAYRKKGLNVVRETATYIEDLAEIITVYLTWAASYEVYWDEERKAREDTMTNYGTHLKELNEKISALIDSVLDPKDEQTRELAKTKGKMEIPPLRKYLEEVVMGYGRSANSLEWYIEKELMLKLGATAEERRQNRKNAPTFDLVERMKEHMQVWTDGHANEDRYTFALADLSYQWHNLLVQFHDNLHSSYAAYLEQNPVQHEFPKQSLSVIDMSDVNNHALLSNYDEFHNLYTKSGTPVVLSNVNMTTYPLTLEHILEQCGHIDVSNRVKQSPAIGEKSNKQDAGLSEYELEYTLASEHRIASGGGGGDSDEDSDDDEDEELTYYADITLRQFDLLKSHVPGLYLHDWSVGEECSSLFYDTTLYGTNQTFKIPTVLAGYDLTQRIYNRYANMFPTLSMGTKGTNEKLQVSMASSGYFSFLVQGRKRWTVYHSAERPYLYQRMSDGPFFAPDVLGMDKTKTANEFLTKRFPLLHRAEQVYEFIQEPGQIMYIPPNSPFAMENLEDVVEIGMLTLPREAAFGSHLHGRIHKDREYGFVELALKYKLFDENADKAATSSRSGDPLYMTFAEYKGQM